MEIDDDVVIGRDGRDEREHRLRRCRKALIFGIYRDDMNALAFVIIFGCEAWMPLSRKGARVHQSTVAVVAPSEHFEHAAA